MSTTAFLLQYVSANYQKEYVCAIRRACNHVWSHNLTKMENVWIFDFLQISSSFLFRIKLPLIILTVFILRERVISIKLD
jgi:hypothetical protein